jgi:hypothetical protein
MESLDQARQSVPPRRTRRNFMAMGAIAGSALLARTRAASAVPTEDEQCCINDGSPPGPVVIRCFLRGTKIQTILGERKVETLAIGDLLPTVFGGMRPIQWMGSHRHKRSDPCKPWVKDVRPVRIARSALGPETPHADLFLTQAHAVYIDGALVQVGDLINGTTITLHPAEEFSELEFFHIKLETHDVIHAEGAPCETLLTVDESLRNFADYFRRYGEPQGEDQPCVPVLSYGGSGRRAIKSRLRSAMSPWIDHRQQFDVIRDRLEERALALGRRLEAV